MEEDTQSSPPQSPATPPTEPQPPESVQTEVAEPYQPQEPNSDTGTQILEPPLVLEPSATLAESEQSIPPESPSSEPVQPQVVPTPETPEPQTIERPASPEREVIEKQSLSRTVTEASEVSRTGVPRELNEEEQQALYKSRLKTLSTKGNQSRSARCVANHTKIIEYLKQHGYITNNEVEKLCHVADSTATLYLKQLEKQTLVISIGKRGKNLRWRLREGVTPSG